MGLVPENRGYTQIVAISIGKVNENDGESHWNSHRTNRFEDEMDLQTSQFGTAFSKILQGFHSRKPIQFSSMIFPRLNVDP
jgi:hypothetical protein